MLNIKRIEMFLLNYFRLEITIFPIRKQHRILIFLPATKDHCEDGNTGI